jgi:hypothetical protein
MCTFKSQKENHNALALYLDASDSLAEPCSSVLAREA